MRTELKVLRTKNHLTQMEIAEKLGISYSTYNLIENGKRRGSNNFWLTLQKVFKLEDGEVWKMQQLN